MISAREALVAKVAGLTRDRRYGTVYYQGYRWLLIDTGGISFGSADMEEQVLQQTRFAIDEADLVCLVVCAHEGLTSADAMIAEELRRADKPIWLVVNKLDGSNEAFVQAEFAELGVQPCFCITALRGRHVRHLRQAFAAHSKSFANGVVIPDAGETTMRLAFLGRPNAGKSTLINTILGQNRLLVSAHVGTTRDSISVPFEYGDMRFLLIDTAGVRRRKATIEAEKLSVLHALENALMSNVVVLVCSAEGIVEQDAALAAQILKAGRALVIAINKTDLLDNEHRDGLQHNIKHRLGFLRRFDFVFVSALNGSGIVPMLRATEKAWRASQTRLTASQCTRILKSAVASHQPTTGSGRIKLRYAHQGGVQPPRFIIYGSRVDRLAQEYRRYLENFFRRELHLVGTPVVLEFRRTENPYHRH